MTVCTCTPPLQLRQPHLCYSNQMFLTVYPSFSSHKVVALASSHSKYEVEQCIASFKGPALLQHEARERDWSVWDLLVVMGLSWCMLNVDGSVTVCVSQVGCKVLYSDLYALAFVSSVTPSLLLYCTACSAGEYSSASDDGCMPCPTNSDSEAEATVCTCDEGYYRSGTEGPEIGCTRECASLDSIWNTIDAIT